jgi:hypothetical protein
MSLTISKSSVPAFSFTNTLNFENHFNFDNPSRLSASKKLTPFSPDSDDDEATVIEKIIMHHDKVLSWRIQKGGKKPTPADRAKKIAVLEVNILNRLLDKAIETVNTEVSGDAGDKARKILAKVDEALKEAAEEIKKTE